MRTTIFVLPLTLLCCVSYIVCNLIFLVFMIKCKNQTTCDFYVAPQLQPLVFTTIILVTISMIVYISMICCMMIRSHNVAFVAGASCFMASFIWHHSVIMLFMFKYGYIPLYISFACSILQIVMPHTIPPLRQQQTTLPV
jgi:hypothetical protein